MPFRLDLRGEEATSGRARRYRQMPELSRKPTVRPAFHTRRGTHVDAAALHRRERGLPGRCYQAQNRLKLSLISYNLPVLVTKAKVETRRLHQYWSLTNAVSILLESPPQPFTQGTKTNASWWTTSATVRSPARYVLPRPAIADLKLSALLGDQRSLNGRCGFVNDKLKPGKPRKDGTPLPCTRTYQALR